MSEKFYRSTYLNIDLNAILSNYQTFDKLHANQTVISVIKANGYGLGSVRIAQHLMENGASFFAVATLDEAIELRMHGIKAKILILGVIPPKDINKAIQHRVALTVPSKSWLKESIKNISDENEKALWLHLKLDTGMGRLGMKDVEEYKEVVDIISKYDQLVFEGVYTHFACADEPGDSMATQYQKFKELVEQVEKPTYIHTQNSAGALLMDGQFCNAIRLGISLYGYYPSEYVKENVKVHLKPSAQLVSEIVQTKTLNVGDSVSYGSTYTATEPTRIAVLPIGYADGYLRSMQGSCVNVNGHQCEVIGRVCMDQTMVKIPDTVKVGDKVILLDNHVDTDQSVEALAKQQDTINYEVLCNLSRRLPRIYHIEDNTEITNELLK
ncbi:alanine racemase [Staphylococcus warneri]|uniref:alanine racemase n=1 Tax=Staphylococcus warneri TaxID=1292 RepID=UPI0002087AC3|nr:alanine racemase [Staphylococcus warneri]EGG96481.1 alanine racemase [Staphylococcus warneri VCU121]MBF2179028.1 alanine racemase [Staphylococcus warneri]MBF2181419.1 alanine racemase [Staphylococcus warneri]MBF2185895.1 alanine racemase [Staphylococcus warneri]MBF2264919.1 alanine racemase [Staphylococcus warneri]